MLSRYGMDECKPTLMPLDVSVKVSASMGDDTEVVTIHEKMSLYMRRLLVA